MSNDDGTLYFDNESQKALLPAGEDQELETDIAKINTEDIGYSRKVVHAICIFLFFCNLLNNMDHGALPAALPDVKKELGFRNVEMGSLGSYVFLGFVVGNIVIVPML